jgi:hypothetical protein
VFDYAVFEVIVVNSRYDMIFDKFMV